MSGWVSRVGAARLLCAAAGLAFVSGEASGQTLPQPSPSAPTPSTRPPSPNANEPIDVDPNAPLAPLPDLGVSWPTLDTSVTQKPSEPAPTRITGGTKRSGRAVLAGVGTTRYSVSVEGLASLGGSEDLLRTFRNQSALEAERKRSANAAQIGRRAEADADLLTQLLRSQGYYDAAVEPRTEKSGDALAVILTASPGQQYRFAAVELPGLEKAGVDSARLRDAFAVKAGDPVIAADVIAGGLALTQALGEEGFAGAKLGNQDIEVNHQTRLATLVLPVDPGPVARFGVIHVSGRPRFSAHHVAIIARFRSGDRFQRSKLDDLRRALIQTTLIANADIQTVPVNGGRVVDVNVRLEPAPQHTIAGQLGYGTGQGASAEVDWTDRNFFNPEGALTLRGIAGTAEQLLGAQLRFSNFRQRDQTLNTQLTISHQVFAAYKAKTVDLAANIERLSNFIWQKKWTWSYGGEWLATDERGVFSSAGIKDTKTFIIGAVPLQLGYDGSDSLLDPTRGFRLSARVSPEISFHGGHQSYVRAQFDASAYRPVSDRIVLAGRVRFGSISGVGLFDLAPSRRFYSGGGGSVRGYGYQQLGPKDQDGDPIGGRGLAEFGLEGRVRLKSFGGNLGVVPFFDGGSLSSKATPSLSNWRYAAGVGVRYYSSFGPIRVDFGVPLNRQKGDGPFAVSVSLGQAF
ncbi:MAG TPA: BamA/TamA family outer membrane protein [Sphingomicrobium sp.]|nr:BamA/TamA family outer membrane protein [Sphingomicrobium sp.]